VRGLGCTSDGWQIEERDGAEDKMMVSSKDIVFD
jgi:hypothetical protein